MGRGKSFELKPGEMVNSWSTWHNSCKMRATHTDMQGKPTDSLPHRRVSPCKDHSYVSGWPAGPKKWEMHSVDSKFCSIPRARCEECVAIWFSTQGSASSNREPSPSQWQRQGWLQPTLYICLGCLVLWRMVCGFSIIYMKDDAHIYLDHLCFPPSSMMIWFTIRSHGNY